MKALLFAVVLLAGCSLAPVYDVPATPQPAAFKEAAGWTPAAPADLLERGAWWDIFGDPDLSSLTARVQVSNQNVAAATAAADQARALLREQRAALFPGVSATAGVSRTGGGANGDRSRNVFQAGVGASWDADVWGRLRSATASAGAQAEASAADLAAATLAAQGDLVNAYVALRQSDAEIALLDATIAGYERAEQIARNRYAAGIAPRTDLLQAETQSYNTRADRAALQRQRAQFEHAIAVLAGTAPADFALPAAAWQATVPALPQVLPSGLLQRRPDIAAAERRVASANAQIGVARSAYYPSLGLSASFGPSVGRVGELFSLSNAVWSFGVQAAQLVFDAGATSARVDQARAAHAQTVAQYRQTVLTAFQDVEDQLAALQWLQQQAQLQQQASNAADQVEAQVLNRYRAGQVSYSEVVQAQVTALNARRALVQLAAGRQTAAVALVRAVGGGWEGLGR